MFRHSRLLVVLTAISASSWLPTATAQGAFPSRPVVISVGFAAGGGTDITARLLAKRLSEQLGQPVNVENKPGAGGNLAAELATRGNPDGHFIHLSAIGPLTVAPHITKRLGYDPRRDFTPLSAAVTFPNVLVVNAALPFRSLDDYLAFARVRPGAMAYGTSGIGGTGHLSGALLESIAKVDMTHVPYKGGGPAMTDLIGGQVQSLFASAPSAVPQIRAGKIRALAVTGPRRSEALPEVPTIGETQRGYEVSNWYAFVGPPKMPAEIAQRWTREIVRALSDPQVREQVREHGMDAIPSTAQELAQRIEREFVLWERIVKQAGISAE
ncbi:MAG: tripartite tricarboxylate transporter substrate binding protein [Burkholderiales bacterium]|nr:tripartite tricarboxylate transporter substrate binding protein [Burkholderiales bacterium]